MHRIFCVNLGCGNSIANPIELAQKWFNLDMTQHKGVDVVANLEEGLPFSDESVDLLYASHVFEHVRRFPELMEECLRVLKPRGVLTLRVPAAGCRAAGADPTHVWKFEPETWDHFNKDAGDIGYDTLGKRQMGFILKWREVVRHRKVHIDDGKPGSFLTEIIIDYEKDGPMQRWEEVLIEMEKARVETSDEKAKSIGD